MIKTTFDGNVTYATIINPEITISELNVNQNTDMKTIRISTHQTEDDGVVTYFGTVFVEVMNANQTSDERPFELTVEPRK